MPIMPTLGQQQPPMDVQQPAMPAGGMGSIQAQILAAQRQQQLAQALMERGYVPNSGPMGAIAQAFSAYRGNKLDKRADETLAQALERKFSEESRLAAEEAKAKDPMTVRTRYLADAGLDPKSVEGRHYLLTGNLPAAMNKGPMNVSPGGAIVDPITGRVIYQAGFAPREAPAVSLQSVDVPDGKGGARKMNFNPRTGEYSDPFGGAAPAGNRSVKFDFAPGTPPEVIAAAHAAAVANGDMPGEAGGGAGLGYKPPAAENKPLSGKALQLDQDIEDALAAGDASIETAQKHLDRLKAKQVDVGPLSSVVGATRRAFDMGNTQDANLAELKADVTAIVNNGLRLNKGVQTEGDAQREFKAVMDSRDTETMMRALERLQAINRRGIELQKRRRALLYRNLGREEAAAEPVPTNQPAAGMTPAGNVVKYDAQGNRL